MTDDRHCPLKHPPDADYGSGPPAMQLWRCAYIYSNTRMTTAIDSATPNGTFALRACGEWYFACLEHRGRLNFRRRAGIACALHANCGQTQPAGPAAWLSYGNSRALTSRPAAASPSTFSFPHFQHPIAESDCAKMASSEDIRRPLHNGANEFNSMQIRQRK